MPTHGRTFQTLKRRRHLESGRAPDFTLLCVDQTRHRTRQSPLPCATFSPVGRVLIGGAHPRFDPLDRSRRSGSLACSLRSHGNDLSSVLVTFPQHSLSTSSKLDYWECRVFRPGVGPHAARSMLQDAHQPCAWMAIVGCPVELMVECGSLFPFSIVWKTSHILCSTTTFRFHSPFRERLLRLRFFLLVYSDHVVCTIPTAYFISTCDTLATVMGPAQECEGLGLGRPKDMRRQGVDAKWLVPRYSPTGMSNELLANLTGMALKKCQTSTKI